MLIGFEGRAAWADLRRLLQRLARQARRHQRLVR